jgi:hypothetical protein
VDSYKIPGNEKIGFLDFGMAKGLGVGWIHTQELADPVSAIGVYKKKMMSRHQQQRTSTVSPSHLEYSPGVKCIC